MLLVSPELVPELEGLANEGSLELRRRRFTSMDLKDVELVIAATNVRGVNRDIQREAAVAKVWCNVVDEGEEGDFQFAAEATSGGVRLAVSSGGRCPGFAQYVRDSLLDRMGPELGMALAIVSAVRARLLSQGLQDSVKERYMSIVTPSFLEAIRAENAREVDRLLVEAFGVDYTLGQLGGELPGRGE